MLRRFKDSHHFMAFFVQVCATALGLLIALGIDQWKTGREHRRLVAQTCQAIRQELTENQAELKAETTSTGTLLGQCAFLQRLLKAHLAGPIPQDSPLRAEAKADHPFSWHIATLQSTSWDVAVATQALAHMEPTRLQKLSRAFTMQRELKGMRDLALAKVAPITKVGALLDLDRPLDLTRAELKAFAQELDEFLLLLQSVKGIARDLDKAAAEAIQTCGG